MPKSKRVRRAKPRPRRRSAPRRKREEGVDVLTSIVLLVIGACSLGAEEIARRLDAGGAAKPGNGHRPRQPVTTIGWIAADLAVQSANAGGRLGRAAGDLVQRSGASRGLIRRVPGASGLFESMQRRGRREVADGRSMVTRLIRDTTSQSVRGIAETAVKEVAQSPEIATLVRQQSVGIATGTILEVRVNSEQADDRIERRVRSWLHILRPEDGGDHLTAKQLHPPEPVA